MLYPLLSSGAINSLFFGFYGATLNQLPVIFSKPSYYSNVRVHAEPPARFCGSYP
jgi:hypothetical protein